MPSYYSSDMRLDFGFPLTTGVKRLMLATAGCFLLQNLAGGRLDALFGLVAGAAVGRLMLWQFATYLFLHAGAMHLLFNMFALWMLGRDVEAALGTRRFVIFYFLCGIGAGVCAYAFYPPPAVIMGASGAVFGVMTAFAMLYPDRVLTLLVFFVIPVQMKAKYMVMILAGIELLFVISNPYGGGIANFAHLGGALCGYLLMRWSGLCGESRGGGGWRPGVFHARVTGEGQSPDVDEVLDKISRHGLGSLTEEEKELLRRASRR
jgi:membrane associated rhomboid family serine protease